MAKNLDTLIRLSDQTVGRRRRELGEVLKVLADLKDAFERLRREVIKAPNEARLLCGNDAQTVIGGRQTLDEGIRRLEALVAATWEKLNDALPPTDEVRGRPDGSRAAPGRGACAP